MVPNSLLHPQSPLLSWLTRSGRSAGRREYFGFGRFDSDRDAQFLCPETERANRRRVGLADHEIGFNRDDGLRDSPPARRNLKSGWFEADKRCREGQPCRGSQSGGFKHHLERRVKTVFDYKTRRGSLAVAARQSQLDAW